MSTVTEKQKYFKKKIFELLLTICNNFFGSIMLWGQGITMGFGFIVFFMLTLFKSIF